MLAYFITASKPGWPHFIDVKVVYNRTKDACPYLYTHLYRKYFAD